MPNFELTLPNINVDVEVASGSFVVIRQPTQTLNRSSIPIQNVAESAITASYAVTASRALSSAQTILSNVAPTSPQTGSMYFSGSFIYVYTGTQYRSASLN